MYIPWTGVSPKSETEQTPKKMRMSKHVHHERCMTNCPEMRNRCRSFDLHQLSQAAKKPSLLARLFRSKSDDSMKTCSPPVSPKPSPKSSPGAQPRRRFLRVVRDDQNAGEEYVNPHVVRKYNRGFWEKKQSMSKSHSLDESRSSSLSPPKERLPYSVTGPTILKKYHSLDDASIASSPKHATFKEEVEIVEFDMKSKCQGIFDEAEVCQARLRDSATYAVCVRAELAGFDHPGCKELLRAVDEDLEDTMSTLEVISEAEEKLRSPTDERVRFSVTDGCAAFDSDSNSDDQNECQFDQSLEDEDEFDDTHTFTKSTDKCLLPTATANSPPHSEIIDRES